MLGALDAMLLGALLGDFMSILAGRVQSTLLLVMALQLDIPGVWTVWPVAEIETVE